MLLVTGLCTDYVSDRGQVVRAAQDVSFDVPAGKLFTLLGPSGCGKTTTLRSIAGLERPRAGEIKVGDDVVFSKDVFVPPNRRGLGMVFQSYAIWPHMSVFENAAFPLRVASKRISRQEIRERVTRVLKTVDLGDLAEREATKLSGGQQQRLALARALVMEPRILLLDEPLSNLDAKLRERMRFELKRLQRELGITTVYVTHDQSEALALSHSIAVMNAGRIEQLAPPTEVYDRPATSFVARFMGVENLLPVGLEGRDGTRLRIALGALSATVDAPAHPIAGARLTLAVRAEAVRLAEPGVPGHADARIRFASNRGSAALYELETDDGHVLQAAEPRQSRDLRQIGTKISVMLLGDACTIVRD